MEGNFQLALEILKKHYQQCKDLFVINANCSIVIIEIMKQPKKKKKKERERKDQKSIITWLYNGVLCIISNDIMKI